VDTRSKSYTKTNRAIQIEIYGWITKDGHRYGQKFRRLGRNQTMLSPIPFNELFQKIEPPAMMVFA
jgi:hypothetical protein